MNPIGKDKDVDLHAKEKADRKAAAAAPKIKPPPPPEPPQPGARRDAFAQAALTGMLAKSGRTAPTVAMTEAAWDVADATLEAEKRGEKAREENAKLRAAVAQWNEDHPGQPYPGPAAAAKAPAEPPRLPDIQVPSGAILRPHSAGYRAPADASGKQPDEPGYQAPMSHAPAVVQVTEEDVPGRYDKEAPGAKVPDKGTGAPPPAGLAGAGEHPLRAGEHPVRKVP